MMCECEQISAYRTSDGQLFEDYDEAISYEEILNFEKWYKKHRIINIEHIGCIYKWLKFNKYDLLDILNKIDEDK